jgi:hypothetical protein|tara:strand:- start:700 stop:1359 length:660 start_codon:yes stop_codon:yes gene_type:complete
MSKVLVSGCGITFSGERPTWTKVLHIAGVSLNDVSGPAIGNYTILNNLLEQLYTQEEFSHVICQLANMSKLDVELHNNNRWLMEQDSIRNFEFQGYWPSSASMESEVKRHWKNYLYSPGMEEQDIIFKLLLLQDLCAIKKIPLLIVQGYPIKWTNPLVKRIKISDYIIYQDYKKDPSYLEEDHSPKNNVPMKEFQIKLAKKFNDIFLHMDLPKLDKFNG